MADYRSASTCNRKIRGLGVLKFKPSGEIFLFTMDYDLFLHYFLTLLQGSYVYDINGKEYLDALAGLWCNVLGILMIYIKTWCVYNVFIVY